MVSILYQSPEAFYNYDLKLEYFSNNIWKVYFAIAHDIVVNEKKNVLDDITVGLYLEKHLKLKREYEKNGGYQTIADASAYVMVENLDGYVKELKKWDTVLQLAKLRFPIGDRLSEFCDMTAEDIYNEYEALLNHTFVNVESNVKTYDITDGIYELIEELDEGFAIGLPYHNMPILSKETGGQHMGSITLVGGLSNVGKSTLARTVTIPSIIKHGEKIVIILNEEGIKKWQRELLVWVVNNVLKDDLQKHVVRDGKYSKENKELLYKAAKWLKEKTKDHTITVIPFQKYQTSSAIKVIKKYASLGGVKYFILDTFKMDAGKVSENSWMQMQQAMVDINDVIKPEVKNLHILITFQLAKGSAKQRFYTQENVGMAKNIIDPASTCLMIRDLYEDEHAGERRALSVYRLEGKNQKTKIPITLDKDKRYQIIFIVKNREGSANHFQIVCEHDMSRNIIKEVGITSVPVDF